MGFHLVAVVSKSVENRKKEKRRKIYTKQYNNTKTITNKIESKQTKKRK